VICYRFFEVVKECRGQDHAKKLGAVLAALARALWLRLWLGVAHRLGQHLAELVLGRWLLLNERLWGRGHPYNVRSADLNLKAQWLLGLIPIFAGLGLLLRLRVLDCLPQHLA
jgi:hypothetical protein